jgi:hypothetical protein
MKRLFVACAAVALCLVSAAQASAGTLLLYADQGIGNGSSRGLYNFDTSTGTATLRTTVSGVNDRVFGLEVRNSDGQLFGVGENGGLYRVDANTGVFTQISATRAQLLAFAINPISGQAYVTGNNSVLQSIDLTTGALNTIGNMGGVDRGLVFFASGQMYGFDQLNSNLYLVNPSNASTMLVGGSGPAVIVEDSTFDASGSLFLSDFGGKIDQVDPNTGARTTVSTFVGPSGYLGLSTIPSPTATPEPASLTMLSIGALGIAGYSWHRRRRVMGVRGA